MGSQANNHAPPASRVIEFLRTGIGFDHTRTADSQASISICTVTIVTKMRLNLKTDFETDEQRQASNNRGILTCLTKNGLSTRPKVHVS
jgi:hypothetical protein